MIICMYMCKAMYFLSFSAQNSGAAARTYTIVELCSGAVDTVQNTIKESQSSFAPQQ